MRAFSHVVSVLYEVGCRYVFDYRLARDLPDDRTTIGALQSIHVAINAVVHGHDLARVDFDRARVAAVAGPEDVRRLVVQLRTSLIVDAQEHRAIGQLHHLAIWRCSVRHRNGRLLRRLPGSAVIGRPYGPEAVTMERLNSLSVRRVT